MFRHSALSFLLAGLLIATSAQAEEAWHTGTISQIYPLANGAVVVTFDTDAAACANTARPKYHFIQAGQNGMTAEGVKHLLSVALSGAAMGKQVSVNYDTSTVYCYVNRLSVRY